MEQRNPKEILNILCNTITNRWHYYQFNKISVIYYQKQKNISIIISSLQRQKEKKRKKKNYYHIFHEMEMSKFRFFLILRGLSPKGFSELNLSVNGDPK